MSASELANDEARHELAELAAQKLYHSLKPPVRASAAAAAAADSSDSSDSSDIQPDPRDDTHERERETPWGGVGGGRKEGAEKRENFPPRASVCVCVRACVRARVWVLPVYGVRYR
jgi:hypothetical protein